MKIKNKGKVYPSSDSSSSSSSSQLPKTSIKEKDILSILQLLPAAIFSLVSVLSLQDKEVLAYMITHSMKTPLSNCNSPSLDSIKKPFCDNISPFFDCDCFDCYTFYWLKWDNSPNHQVIQQAIEAFEEHLSKDEKSRKSNRRNKSKNSRGKKNMGKLQASFLDSKNKGSSSLEVVNEDVAPPSTILENEEVVEEHVNDVAVVEEESPVTRRSPAGVNSRKGLARKVLPDVLGILNSRLWNLWGPNV